MSLINEALKRTRDASLQATRGIPPAPPAPVYQTAAEPPVSAPPVRLVAVPPSASVRASGRGWYSALHAVLVVLLGVALLGALVAGYMVWRSKQTVPASLPAPASKPLESTAPAPGGPASKTPVVTAQPEAAPAPASPVSEEQIVARVVEKIKSEQPPTAPMVANRPQPARPPRALPKLTLQGITRDKSGYEALINGWNVRVGGEIEGARVTAIENGVVKLEFDGQEVVLRLR